MTRHVLAGVDDLRSAVGSASDRWSVVQQWYVLAMLTVAPFPTDDNDRYPDAHPTGLRAHLTEAHGALAAA